MRLDLGEGQWADISSRLTFGQIAGIRTAALASLDEPMTHPSMQRAYVTGMVTGWSIRDFDGAEIAFAPDNLDRLPAKLADRIYAKCLEVFRQYMADPKDESAAETSAGSSPTAA